MSKVPTPAPRASPKVTPSPLEKDEPWVESNPAVTSQNPPATDLSQPFDLYIDSVRFIPDNASMIKVGHTRTWNWDLSSFCVPCKAKRHIGITLSSVCLCVFLSSRHTTFFVVTHSYVSQATHAFLGMLPLFSCVEITVSLNWIAYDIADIEFCSQLCYNIIYNVYWYHKKSTPKWWDAG